MENIPKQLSDNKDYDLANLDLCSNTLNKHQSLNATCNTGCREKVPTVNNGAVFDPGIVEPEILTVGLTVTFAGTEALE